MKDSFTKYFRLLCQSKSTFDGVRTLRLVT